MSVDRPVLPPGVHPAKLLHICTKNNPLTSHEWYWTFAVALSPTEVITHTAATDPILAQPRTRAWAVALGVDPHLLAGLPPAALFTPTPPLPRPGPGDGTPGADLPLQQWREERRRWREQIAPWRQPTASTPLRSLIGRCCRVDVGHRDLLDGIVDLRLTPVLDGGPGAPDQVTEPAIVRLLPPSAETLQLDWDPLDGQALQCEIAWRRRVALTWLWSHCAGRELPGTNREATWADGTRLLRLAEQGREAERRAAVQHILAGITGRRALDFQRFSLARIVEDFAWLAAMQRRPWRAARLWSAADDQRETLHVPRPSLEQPDYEHAQGALRAALGEETYARARARGQTLSLEEALYLALSGDTAPEG
jgi:hypothetical protein